MDQPVRSEFFMNKGILGSIAALLVSSGMIGAQMPAPGGPPVMDGPPPAYSGPYSGMDGHGDWQGHGDLQPNNGAYPGLPPFWIRGEYMLWHLKPMQQPDPLVTSSLADSFGIIGNPTTSIILGGSNVDFHDFTGGRLSGGLYFCCDPNLGLEVSAFTTEKQTNRFSATSDPNGNPVLARPFFDVVSGTENAIAISFPGAFAGSVNFLEAAQFWGGDMSLSLGWNCSSWLTATLLGGFMYREFDEQLQVSQFSVILPLGTAQVAGTTFTAPNGIAIQDNFDTRNQFYGGMIGARLEAHYGRLSAEFTEKFGIGATHQVVGINGFTAGVSPPITTPGNQLSNTFPGLFPPVITLSNGITAVPGGVLATSTNSGQHINTTFSVASETDINIRLKVTSCISLMAGYSFLYLNKVVRPGTEIDRNVNQAGIPSSPAFTNFIVFPRQPTFSFNEGNIWANGVSAGLQIDF
jgi:hypothetical protein